MDPAARKDVIAKRISVLLNMLVKEGLRPSHQMQLNKELKEYMDMDDGGDYTLTEDEEDSDEDSSEMSKILCAKMTRTVTFSLWKTSMLML